MRCDEFEDRLHELLDGRANLLDDRALNQHAHDCRACRAWRDAMLAMSDGVELLTAPPTVQLTPRVLDELQRQHTRAQLGRRLLQLAPIVLLVGLTLGWWYRSASHTVISLPQPSQVVETPVFVESGARDEDAWQLLAGLSNWPTPWFDAAPPIDVHRSAPSQPTSASLGIESVTRSATAAFDMLWQGLPNGAEEPRS